MCAWFFVVWLRALLIRTQFSSWQDKKTAPEGGFFVGRSGLQYAHADQRLPPGEADGDVNQQAAEGKDRADNPP